MISVPNSHRPPRICPCSFKCEDSTSTTTVIPTSKQVTESLPTTTTLSTTTTTSTTSSSQPLELSGGTTTEKEDNSVFTTSSDSDSDSLTTTTGGSSTIKARTQSNAKHEEKSVGSTSTTETSEISEATEERTTEKEAVTFAEKESLVTKVSVEKIQDMTPGATEDALEKAEKVDGISLQKTP